MLCYITLYYIILYLYYTLCYIKLYHVIIYYVIILYYIILYYILYYTTNAAYNIYLNYLHQLFYSLSIIKFGESKRKKPLIKFSVQHIFFQLSMEERLTAGEYRFFICPK